MVFTERLEQVEKKEICILNKEKKDLGYKESVKLEAILKSNYINDYR